MHVIVDFSIMPVGTGVSLCPYIAECEHVLEDSGINIPLRMATHMYFNPIRNLTH